ncbi:S-layer homology domain-containing protein [Lysinibacillus sphaericus]
MHEYSESRLIQSAFEIGIVTGNKDGTFRPDGTLT